jgi:hypothetical protein
MIPALPSQPLPIVWRDHRILTGGYRSPFNGIFALAWIGWPALGVSLLHSMNKREDAQ